MTCFNAWSSALLLLSLAAQARAPEHTREWRDGRDMRDVRAGRAPEGKLYLSLLSSLPATVAQGTGSLTGVAVARSGVRGCTRDDGLLVLLSTNQLCVEAQGILVEKGVTNLVVRSQELQLSPWSYLGSQAGNGLHVEGPDTDALTAPDGTATAERLTVGQNVTGGGDYCVLRQQSTVANATGYVLSAYLKAGSGQWVSGYINSGTFTPTTCTLTASWGRCLATKTSASTTVYPTLGYVGPDATSMSGWTMGAWGLQLELGDYPHAYVPTAGSSAASADDVVTVANPLAGAQGKFCLGATFKPTGGRSWESRSGDIALWQLGASGANNSISAKRDTSNKVVLVIQDAAGGTKTFTGTDDVTGTAAKRVTYCHALGGGAVFLNGAVAGGSWTGSGTGAVVLGATLTLGRLASASSTMLDGHVSNLCLDTRSQRCL